MIAVATVAIATGAVLAAPAKREGVEAAPSPAAIHSGGRDGTPGQQRRWALTFDVGLDRPGNKEPIRMQLTGDWVTTISAVRDGEVDVACELVGAHLTGAGTGLAGASPAELESVGQRFGRRFWVTFRSDGATLSVHFPKDVDPSDRNLLLMLATGMQLVRPARNEAQWTALERDGAGMYLAVYQRAALDQIVKRKLKYVETDGGSTARSHGTLQVDVDASEQHFSLDAGGAIAAFSGSDHVRIGMPMGQGGQLDIRTSTRLVDLRVGEAPELAGSLERARPTVDSSPIRTQQLDPEEALARHDRTVLAGHSTEDLLAAASTGSAAQELPGRLAALFRRRPDAIAPALALGGKKIVTDALATAGTPAALGALDRLVHDRAAPVPARINAINALVRAKRPSAAAMRIPGDLLDDGDAAIRRAARFLDGALARAGRSDHPTEADAIDQALLSRYASAKAVGERVELLGALGNSAGPSVLPAIEGTLADSQPEVRAAAARALRLAAAPAVDDRLAAAITGDRDRRVRAAAIFAAGFRAINPPGGTLIEALLRAATDDPAENVRAAAVGLLRRRRDASPKITATLARVAESDPKPGMRRLAREALADDERPRGAR